MAFCSKCGNELTEEAMFCSVCGCSGETTEEVETVQPNVEIDNQPVIVPPVKKKNPIKFIIPIVAVVLIVAIGLGIVFFTSSKKLTTTNKDGEKVFNLTFEEYIDNYNKNNADLSTMKAEYFDKDVNSDGEFYYSLDESMLLFFVGEYSYDDNIETIKFNVDTDEEDAIPNGILYIIKAFYPELTISDAKDIAQASIDMGYLGYIYKDIEISCDYNEDYEYQYWYVDPVE